MTVSKNSISYMYLIVALLSAVVYLNTLWCGFVWDDDTHILKKTHIAPLSESAKFFTKSVTQSSQIIGMYYRPLFSLSLSIDHAIFGDNPIGFHATNILLHILSSLLATLLARRLLESDVGGFIAGLIFAVHPAHSEAVAWVSARVHPMGAIFVMLAVYFYALFRDDEGKTRHIVASIIATALAGLSVEIGVMAIFLIALYELIYKRPSRIIFLLPYALTLVLYLGVRNHVLKGILRNTSATPIWIRLLDAVNIAGTYLREFILPINLKLGYDIKTVGYEHRGVMFFEVFLLVSSFFALIYFARNLSKGRPHKAVVFGLAWFFLCIAPALNIVQRIFPFPMSLRYLYIPSFGLVLAIGAFVPDGLLSLRTAKAGLAGVVLAMGLLVMRENARWKDDLTMFKGMVADNPDSWPARFFHADAYNKAGLDEEAIAEFKEALRLNDPNDPIRREWFMHGSLSFLYAKKGMTDEAIKEGEKALSQKPDFFEIRYNLGMMYENKGMLAEAVESYKEAVKLMNTLPQPYYRLGVVSAKLGDQATAQTQYFQIKKLDPKLAESYIQEINAIR